MSDELLHRRAEENGFLGFYSRWKVVISGLTGLIIGIWVVVPRADGVVKNADKVPAIEEAILQLKTNQETAERRFQRLEERQSKVEHKLDSAQQEILDKLDLLVERR